jgi:uncharacterized protein (DUF2235 family)
MSTAPTDTDARTGGRSGADSGRDHGARPGGKPRNLVICSDGTGNSAGKGRGTNVWLFYEALDRQHRSVVQLAIHDDGVGTSRNTILAALGGAFGFGLAHNVRELYSWLCKHYQQDDRIFLVGFSRGAFTVRCLAAMIATFGILKWEDGLSEGELRSWVWEIWFAYKDAQRDAEARDKHTFDYDRDCSWIGKFLDRWARARRKPEFFEARQIEFIGVWDTVDAYGLPVDELKEAFAWISRKLLRWWPLHYLALTRFTDNKLNTSIKNAYHAVAIDDERHTFHPVLWDAPDASKGQTIRQVWFSGMHSDVGGGYERRSLSLVPLLWIMEKAADHGLEFEKDKWDHIDSEKDALGPMHDSRSGLAAYYRYRPRDVQSLCEERHVAPPVVHASVLDRIRAQRGEEAPGVLPPRFEVEGRAALPGAAALRPDGGVLDRLKSLHLSRGALHNLFVGWTLLLVTVVLVLRGQADHTPAPSWSLFGIGYLVSVARSFIPEIVGDTLRTLRAFPFYTLLLAAIFGVLWKVRHVVDDRIRQLRRAAWNRQLKTSAQPRWLGVVAWICRQLRRPWPSSVEGKRTLARTFAVVASLGIVSFITYAWWDGVLLPPEPDVDPPRVEMAMPESFEFDFETTNPGHVVGPVLEAGESYAIAVKVTRPWKDGGREAAPEGLSQASAGPARWLSRWRLRDWRYPPFALLGSVSGENGTRFRIGDGSRVPSPLEDDSRLVVFVNDATCYVCPSGPWAGYADNEGAAEITIRRLPPEPPSP